MTLLLHAHSSETNQVSLERHARTYYSRALYDACHQSDDQERRERAYHDLSHYLYRAAHNRWPDLAEDVTQHALLLVYEQIERCRAPETFLTFALFKLLQAFKAMTTQTSVRTSSLLDSDQMSETTSDDLHTTPLTHLEQRETVEALLVAIQCLPDERQRQVVVLRYFAGLSDAIIAQRLDLTANHVRVLRTRALERLRHDASLQHFYQNP
ncbi:MAG: sigma-70 family RNA polymerase sigma factor [Chloroflexaceae bacterium]|nr:sigma-70 family RNA polymerase sigma factor [Chloroflexaceae bacterium]